MLAPLAALLLCATPAAAAVPERLDVQPVDPARVGRALTLFDEHTTGTVRTIGALTVSGGIVAIAMGATAKYRWHEQLGGSYALIGGGLSTATGLLLLFGPSPIHDIRLRFESERESSPELAAEHALARWRALNETARSRRDLAIGIQTGVGAAAVLAGLAAVATPWFDRAGSSYARHTFAEAFIPLGAALVAGGLAARRGPPPPLEIGYELAAGVVPLRGGAAVGLQGTF